MSQIKPFSIDGNTITIRVQVQPRSSSIRWGGLLDNQWIQLRITSPPVDGEANKMCLKVIAKRFKTAKSNVRIIKGEKNRYKTIVVVDCDPERLSSFTLEYATA